MYYRPRATRHSRWNDPGAHGEHKGYVPGEYDPTTGITNPDRKGYVRSWRNPDSVQGPGGLLATLTPFTGHSIRATREVHDDGSFTYTVYSYDQDIASWHQPKFNPDDPGRDMPVVQASTRKYSHITSTHQGMVRAWMGHAVDKWIAPTEYGD